MTKIVSALACLMILTGVARAATISFTNDHVGMIVKRIVIKVYYAIPEQYWNFQSYEESGPTTTECAYDAFRLTIYGASAVATPLPWADWLTDADDLWWSESTGEPVMLLAYPDDPDDWELANVPYLIAHHKYAVYDRIFKVNLVPGESVSTVLPDEVLGKKGDEFDVSPYVSYSISTMEEPLPEE